MTTHKSRVIALTLAALVPFAIGRAGSDTGHHEPTTDGMSAMPAAPASGTIVLDWYSLNSGGSTAAVSANYQLGVSVGQSLSGVLTGSQFRLGLGFWYGMPGGSAPCPIVLSGDVNESGSITSADIIALVNFVFKGGDPPVACEANGDVNCNGSVTSADIIFEVNFVFKGGAPPCDICSIIPGVWTCP